MWSWGVPADSDVWRSVEYSETMTGGTDTIRGLVDARGKLPDGTHWRYRGILGNSCDYSRAPQSVVQLLDHIMECAKF